MEKLGIRKFVLFSSIIIVQIVIIALLLIEEQIDNGLLTANIMAVVAKEDDRYLLYEIDGHEGIIDISDSVKYLNYKTNKVYLYNQNKLPIETLSYDASSKKFTTSNANPIIYTQNDFSCFANTCLVKDTTTKLKLAKAFKAKKDYVYLDAIIF